MSKRATDAAAILVAGQGTRLRPLTIDQPKALVEVRGEAILARATRLLIDAGVRRLVVATGYRADAIRAALARCPIDVTYCHNEAFASTQNSVSLHLCADALRGQSFFKLDGDVLFRPEVLSRLADAAAPLSVAVDRSGVLGPEEMKVRVDAQGRITAFGKELSVEQSAGESIGIERVDASVAPALFDALAKASAAGRMDVYYEALYGELIDAGLDARLVDVSDLPWTEVDDHDDLARAEALVAGGKLDPPRRAG